MAAASRATTQILGKFRSDPVSKTSSAGRPKSDCDASKPYEYGASMAAMSVDTGGGTRVQQTW